MKRENLFNTAKNVIVSNAIFKINRNSFGVRTKNGTTYSVSLYGEDNKNYNSATLYRNSRGCGFSYCDRIKFDEPLLRNSKNDEIQTKVANILSNFIMADVNISLVILSDFIIKFFNDKKPIEHFRFPNTDNGLKFDRINDEITFTKKIDAVHYSSTKLVLLLKKISINFGGDSINKHDIDVLNKLIFNEYTPIDIESVTVA